MATLGADSSAIAIYVELTHAISRTESLADIYQAALDALESGLGVRRASILLFDSDGVMRFKAWRGLSDTYRRAVEGHTPWSPDSKNAQPIVVPNVDLDHDLAPFLPAIRAEGIAALAFIPLEAANGVLGKFMLYYDDPRDLSPDELQLAGLVAAQVAFAVERTQAKLTANASEERLRFALDAANMGTWDWNLRTNTVRWSENVERLHGLPAGTFDGSFASYEREIHPDDRGKVIASIQRALEHGVAHDVEYRIVAPDGTVRWVEGKGRIEFGPDGKPARMTGVCMNITRRKHAEFARAEASELSNRALQRLGAIVESSDDAIVSKDLDGIIASWNRGAEKMFGYTAEEAIGRSITLIVPPDRLAEEDFVLSRVRSGVPVEMETIRRRKDGVDINISLKVSPIKESGGRIVAASKIARDITARKRDEAERAELHRRLTVLVTASASLLDSPEAESVRSRTLTLAQQLLVADGYAVWTAADDRPGWRVAASEGISPRFAARVIDSYRGTAAPTAALFSEPLAVEDVAAQPLLGEQLAAYSDEGIRSMLVCPMRLGFERAGTLVFYYRSRHSFSDVDVQTGQALANLAAAALTTAALYDEQKAQRQAAESARRHAAFLADATAILSQSLDYEHTLAAVARLAVPEIADFCAVDIVDDAGRLQRLAVARANGTGGAPATLAVDPDSPERVNIEEVVRTGLPALIGPLMSVPLVSTTGPVGAMTFVFADPERRYTGRDLAFGQDVAARAALALDNAFAYRRAHDANRLKDEFLATLSHELRTPLNAILGYAQMLNMGMLAGERQSKAITVLTRNAESLRQLIDDVLDVSRITAGKIRLNVQSIDLAEILRNAVATVQPAADAKGVSLQFKAGAPVESISGDPDRLQQVMWNLLTNAVKFTPRGGHVQARLAPADHAVDLVIEDDGRGIGAAFLPHIFERFRQADSRFAREHGGLGLGLAIVHDLVEMHGGTVTAASEGPGRGSRFTVRLPSKAVRAQAPHSGPAAATHAPAPASEGLSEVLKGARLLAVDDEEDALGLLRLILESAGAEVTTAGSAPRALDLLQHATFDAVIADLGMPRMDGFELIKNVRRTLTPPGNRVPAAALTAYARSEDRAAALANGYQMHIAKPVNPTELVTAIAELLGRA